MTSSAPTEAQFESQLASCKAHVWQFLQQVPGSDLVMALHAGVAPDATWHISHPLNEMTGPQAVAERFYGPLRSAFPDLERRIDLFFGGHWTSPAAGSVGYSPPEVRGEGWWVTAAGHYIGTFRQPWLGIPATGVPAVVRFGEFYRWQPHPVGQGGRITEARVLLDIVDLARQAGRPLLPPGQGLDWLVPGPAPHDGILLGTTDPSIGRQSLRRTLDMFQGLFDFDGVNLDSMGMERFWHPNMMWYGPCGIGTTRGVGGFQRHHQQPFLHAFPDRKGVGHRARFAEGPFVASTGWPSVAATHTGDYLGVPATGRSIGMRVADWWRCDGNLLTENWVLIDLPHLLLQMDVDVMAALRD